MASSLAWLVWLAIAAAAPFVASDHLVFQIGIVATTAAIASGLTLVTGIAGQISIAQPVFVAVGAYGAALLNDRLGIPLLLGIPMAAVAAGLFGWGVGFICLRLDGHYLALVTLALTGIAHYTLLNVEFLGGAVGMAVPPLRLADRDLTSTAAVYGAAVIAGGLTLFAVDRIIRSRFGRVLDALRQSDIAAVSLGVDRRAFRTQAVAISAAAGAFAGGFQATQLTYLDPQQFGLLTAIQYIAIIVVGGMRSVHGAIVGAAVFVFMPDLLSRFQHYMAFVLYGLVVLSIVLLPGGLVSLAAVRRRPRPSAPDRAGTPGRA